MKRLVAFGAILIVLSLGALWLARHHVVKTGNGMLILAKPALTYRDTFVDVRNWSSADDAEAKLIRSLINQSYREIQSEISGENKGASDVGFGETPGSVAATPPRATNQPGLAVTDDKSEFATDSPTVQHKLGDTMSLDFGDGGTLEMVWIEPGTFMMGSPPEEALRDQDELQHRVTLTKGFWIGKYEVTQGQWEYVMGSNPARFKETRNPVERVSWNDCQAFIRKLNEIEGWRATLQAGLFRLPTEAEWEYACRAGTMTAFHYGNDLDAFMANVNGEYPYGNGQKGQYRETTTFVGSFKPNAWGLYDMHGNVREWCADWYGKYPTGNVTDPTGSDAGLGRIIRGGGWGAYAKGCRSAFRFRLAPEVSGSRVGLRLVRGAHVVEQMVK